MEGIPARFLIDALIIFVKAEGFAYSLRYIAQATPNGTENKVVIHVSSKVPMIAGSIPPFVIPLEGNLMMNSHETEDRPFEKMS